MKLILDWYVPKAINFVLQMVPSFFPGSSTGSTSYTFHIISIHLGCFLPHNNFEDSSSNHGLCYLNL